MKSSSPISRLKVRDWLLRVTLKYMYVVSNIPTGCLSFPFGPFPPPFSTPASCVLPLVQEYTFGLPETCSRSTDDFFFVCLISGIFALSPSPSLPPSFSPSFLPFRLSSSLAVHLLISLLVHRSRFRATNLGQTCGKQYMLLRRLWMNLLANW